MNKKDQQIYNLLWKEVALKSQSAAMAFTAIAIFTYFYHFGTLTYKSPIQFLSIFIILPNIVRFALSKKIERVAEVSFLQRTLLKMSVWFNSISWGIIFSLAAIEINFSTHHFAILVSIIVSFTGSSIVTLSYDKWLFIPHQVAILMPLMGISLYQYFNGQNDFTHYLFLTYLVFFLYQIKQYMDYRHQLMSRFENQIKLEDSYIELKLSQTALVERTTKLVQTSKITAVGEMAGGLAHEVNNSNMVILGSLFQIERDLKQENALTPKIQTRLDTANEAIMKIKTVIESLKYFSQQMEPAAKEPVALKEIAQRTLHYSQELLKAHAINFEMGAVPEININCHSFQITQILFNLIKNADDAILKCPDSDKWIRITFEIQENDILIRVINSGPKISSETQQKLFQPFFSTKEINQGTGLSLSISKGLAKDHSGDLFFEDEARNTTFGLKLPARI